VCVNSPVTFTASGANTYSWSTASANAIITVTPSANTNYTVTGTDTNGCSSINSVLIKVNACVGIKKLSYDDDLTIIPNPNTGNFYVDLPEELNLSGYTIYNTMGQKVRQGPAETSRLGINARDLAPGIYILYLFNNDNLQLTIKFIRE
jgi:hypothetical protein